MRELMAGFNLVIYGFGSKRTLLQFFRERYLEDHYVVEIDGNGINMTDFAKILSDISSKLNGTKLKIGNRWQAEKMVQIYRKISEKTSEKRGDFIHIFWIIHTIDSPTLRSNQHVLGRIARIPNNHIIASADHIRFPLIWDARCREDLNIICHCAHTYHSYKREIMVLYPMLPQWTGLGGGGEQSTVVQIIHILRSQTPAHRSLLRLLAEIALNTKSQQLTVQQILKETGKTLGLPGSRQKLLPILTEMGDQQLLGLSRDDKVLFSYSSDMLNEIISLVDKGGNFTDT
eukprot:GHVL01043851.1.p1 GENE.GHVL01043851.1~~GHVL01043851.1.p1  ORF type:complete len:288 (+),score=44.34 GHVL01043851.1:729-1592(+)